MENRNEIGADQANDGQGDSGNLVDQTSSAKRMRIDVGTKKVTARRSDITQQRETKIRNVRKEMVEIEEALEQLDMQSASARKTRRERRAEAHEQFEKEIQVSIDKVKAMEALKDDEVARKEKARAEYNHEQTELQNEQNHLDHLNSQIKNDELKIEGFKRDKMKYEAVRDSESLEIKRFQSIITYAKALCERKGAMPPQQGPSFTGAAEKSDEKMKTRSTMPISSPSSLSPTQAVSKNGETSTAYNKHQLPSTSQPPSTSDEDIEILNTGEISTPIIAPSDSNSRLDEFEECELLFNDMFDVLGTATMNERLMDYLLARIWKEESKEEIRESVFIFPSLFYKRLTKAVKNEGSADEEEEKLLDQLPEDQRKQRMIDAVHANFDDVSGVTRGVNIFDKEFVLIPIIERNHCYLMIIVKPSACIVNSKESRRGRSEKRAILIDSFYGNSSCRRNSVIHVIRTYMHKEYERMNANGPTTFDSSRLFLTRPSIPQQKNHADCGFFVVKNAEIFLSNPLVEMNQIGRYKRWSKIDATGNSLRREVETRIKNRIDNQIWTDYEKLNRAHLMKKNNELYNENLTTANDFMILEPVNEKPSTSAASTSREGPAAKRNKLDDHFSN